MDASRVEETILSAVGSRWTKVAMVIARVAKTMGGDSLAIERWEAISDQIEELVNDGRLAARGDTTNWRGSEVRRVEAERPVH